MGESSGKWKNSQKAQGLSNEYRKLISALKNRALGAVF
jgi:hypothetical protein